MLVLHSQITQTNTLPEKKKFVVSRQMLVMIALAVVLGIIIYTFMTINARGSWNFILKFRGTKLAAMALVGYSIAVSTVLFQTVANNKILTPSIMGFDSLYVLLQTLLVFTLGSAQVVRLSPNERFFFEVLLMVSFSAMLYRWLFVGTRNSLHLLMLVGIIFGTLFRSLTMFMQRIIDPNEYEILQDLMFASFNSFDRELLTISAVAIAIISLVIWRLRHTFDVLSLGREMAINLGVNYYRVVTVILICVTVLISVSTALVGPVTFFGLLVANLAYQLIGTHKHIWILPCAAVLAMIFLLGGQMIVERVFAFDTSLSIIVEFIGGIVFILLLLRGGLK
jgi:iron complex transport system permease protein